MAEDAFLMVTQEERERAQLLSEYKFAMDLQDQMITAREEGWDEGGDWVLDLLDQGLSVAEIKRQLTGR
jgi:hypothetical protein